MTRQDGAAITQRLYDEIWNGQCYETAADLFDPEFRHDAAPGIRGGAAKAAAPRRRPRFAATMPPFRTCGSASMILSSVMIVSPPGGP